MLSPLIIGGQKLNSNYIESIDYIPGNVLRAAFARVILNHCTAYSGEVEEIDGQKRVNWVHYRNKESCKKCKYKRICERFSDIKFGFFYPQGTTPIVMSQMVCKNDEKHSLVDSLTYNKANGCPTCKGRLEYTKGFSLDNKIFKTKKSIYTRVEIDRYTKTSKDGRLYTLMPVLEEYFVGEIQGIEESELDLFDDLRVGSYVSVGFGRCKLEKEKELKEDKNKILLNMQKFSNKYKEVNNKKDNLNYFALLLETDARVKLENLEGYKTTEEYKNILANLLNLNSDFKIDKVYLETNIYRGYDTSMVGDTREEAVYQILKGSVFIISSSKNFEEIKNNFSELTIGEENLNGFGKIRFYFGGVENAK
jgi:hypothetical protein